eukprot:g46835.t1
MFKYPAGNLDEYATAVMDFISKYMEDDEESIWVFPNHKPWMNQEIHSLLNTRHVRSVLLGVNPRKAMGPDGFPDCALRPCVDQLMEVFTDIFNFSLLQAKVPTCFKKTSIIPVPKKTYAVCLNDYRPVALISMIMKRFKKLRGSDVATSRPIMAASHAVMMVSQTIIVLFSPRVAVKEMDSNFKEVQIRVENHAAEGCFSFDRQSKKKSNALSAVYRD